MRNRSKASPSKEKRERIIANTLIRTLIDHLLEKEDLCAGITANNEEGIRQWVKKYLNSKKFKI